MSYVGSIFNLCSAKGLIAKATQLLFMLPSQPSIVGDVVTVLFFAVSQML